MKPDYFDTVAATWDNHAGPPQSALDKLLNLLSLQENSSVLDIGTGTGILIPHLRERIGTDGHITAVDKSHAMLAQARYKFGTVPHTRFLQLDIETLLPPETYDAIIMYSVYPHLKHPIETLCKLYRNSLKTGGTLLIAHSAGRQTINEIHQRHRHELSSATLPPAEDIVMQLRQKGIPEIFSEDSDSIYYIAIFHP